MELVYSSENIERATKNTCKEIKEKINLLEKKIDNNQKYRNKIISNKKLTLPPAGINQTRINNSMINWQNSLRN